MRARLNVFLSMMVIGTFFAAMGCGGSSKAKGWQPLGALGTSGAVAPNVAWSGKIAATGGVPYAAYVDSSTGKLRVVKWDGKNWAAVGDTNFTAMDYYYSLYVDGSTPYVAAIDSTTSTYAITVLEYTGGNWIKAGGTGPTITSAYTASHLLVSNGTVYLAYVDDGTLNAEKTTGASWVNMSPPGGDPYDCGLAIVGTTLYLVYGDDTGLNLASYDGATWTSVATSTVGISEDDSRCAGYSPTVSVSDGAIYVSYFNSTYGAVFLKLNGSTLESVGTLGSISGTVNDMGTITADDIECVSGTVYKSTPYVAFDDESRDGDPEPRAATVKYFDGTAWQLYGSYPSPNDIESTMLVVDPSNGNLYLTYEDDTLGGMTVQVD